MSAPELAAVGGVAALTVFGIWSATLPPIPKQVRPIPSVERAPVPAAENALTELVKAGNRLQYPSGDGSSTRLALSAVIRGKDTDAREVDAFLRVNSGSLAALTAARKVPRFEFSAPHVAVDTKLPSFQPAQTLTRLAIATSLRRLTSPKAAAPLRPLADALHVARRFMYAPGEAIIVNLVGAVIIREAIGMALNEQSHVLGRPDSEVRALLTDLNGMDPMERPLEQLLVGERDALLTSLSDGSWVQRDIGGGEMGPVDRLYSLVGTHIAGDIRLMADYEIDLVSRRDFVAHAAYVAQRQAPENSRAFIPPIFLHPFRCIAMMMAGSQDLTGAAARILEGEAQFDSLRVALAAELYRRQHHVLPASLADLVPTLLPAAPADPYRPATPLGWQGGKLWSIAWDGKDQGGKVILRPTGQPPKPDRETSGDLMLLPPLSFPLVPH